MPGDDHDKLIEIGSDVKHILAKFEAHCQRIDEAEDKISALENWRSATVAGIGVLTVLIGWGLLTLP